VQPQAPAPLPIQAANSAPPPASAPAQPPSSDPSDLPMFLLGAALSFLGLIAFILFLAASYISSRGKGGNDFSEGS